MFVAAIGFRVVQKTIPCESPARWLALHCAKQSAWRSFVSDVRIRSCEYDSSGPAAKAGVYSHNRRNIPPTVRSFELSDRKCNDDELSYGVGHSTNTTAIKEKDFPMVSG